MGPLFAFGHVSSKTITVTNSNQLNKQLNIMVTFTIFKFNKHFF